MSDRPDIRGRMEPNDSFLHKIAGIIPGYRGYVDREQRRDADKMLRMYIGRQYREQHAALMRVQQHLARTRQFEAIAELDRLGGMLQRFVDKVETATYGYTGLFDPIKVEAEELDQIYAFDERLLDSVQHLGAAIGAVEAASRQGSGARPGETAGQLPDINGALAQLGTVLDGLLEAWNRRQDLLISGRPMPADEFERFRTEGSPTTALPGGAAAGSTSGGAGYHGGQGGYGAGTAGGGSVAGAGSEAGEMTQRFDSGQGGGWESRTTAVPPNTAQGYAGNVPRADAGETPAQDDLGGMGGAGMSRAGAIGAPDDTQAPEEGGDLNRGNSGR